MKNVNYKTAIVPVVAVACLGYASISGHTISADLQTQIVDVAGAAVGVVIGIWGIFKSHKKVGK